MFFNLCIDGWINGLPPVSGPGYEVGFTVDPNPNHSWRVGHYQVSDQIVTVYQYGPGECASSPLVIKQFPNWPESKSILDILDEMACPNGK